MGGGWNGGRGGRHSEYTPEIARWVCDLVAASTVGLNELCKTYPDFPEKGTIYKWLRAHPDFGDLYYQAKSIQSQRMVEEIDDMIPGEIKFYFDANGNQRIDAPSAMLLTAKASHRRWQAARLAPKVYGDAQKVDELQAANAQVQSDLADLRAKLAEQNKREY